jgi:hypothetical protein
MNRSRVSARARVILPAVGRALLAAAAVWLLAVELWLGATLCDSRRGPTVHPRTSQVARR